MPWLRSFTVSFLYEEESPPLRSTPWGAYRTFGCHILVSQLAQWPYLECTYSINHHHLPGTHFTDPRRDGRLSQPASSGAQTCHLLHKSQTCYWLSYLCQLQNLSKMWHNHSTRDIWAYSYQIWCFYLTLWLGEVRTCDNQSGIKVLTGNNSEIWEIFPDFWIYSQIWEFNNSQIWECMFGNLGIFPRFQKYSQFRPWYLTDNDNNVEV